MMRILFVAEQFPYPLHDGGSLRTYHLLKGLSEEFEVWFLSHAAPRPVDPMSVGLDRVARILKVSEPRRLRRCASNLTVPGLHRTPLYLFKNWSAPLLRAVDRVLAERTFDAIHFNMLDTAAFALVRDWPCRMIFDTHNCLSDMAGGLAERSRGLRRAVLAREAAALRDYEHRVCRRMDLNLVCSDHDADRIRSLCPHAPVLTISNGVETDYFRPGNRATEQPGTLVFCGAMSYFPNEEGVQYFRRNVLPLVQQRVPTARFVVVGKSPSAQVRSLHDGSSVIVTGEVEDVRPYLARAEVFVVPLLTGSGTRLKILEAFASRKAVVSTSKGAEGLPVADGRELLIADEAETFAARVAALLESPELRERLAGNGFEFVQEEYDWNSICRRLRMAYETLTHKTPVVQVC